VFAKQSESPRTSSQQRTEPQRACYSQRQNPNLRGTCGRRRFKSWLAGRMEFCRAVKVETSKKFFVKEIPNSMNNVTKTILPETLKQKNLIFVKLDLKLHS
jgi:hypothetical protein